MPEETLGGPTPRETIKNIVGKLHEQLQREVLPILDKLPDQVLELIMPVEDPFDTRLARQSPEDISREENYNLLKAFQTGDLKVFKTESGTTLNVFPKDNRASSVVPNSTILANALTHGWEITVIPPGVVFSKKRN